MEWSSLCSGAPLSSSCTLISKGLWAGFGLSCEFFCFKNPLYAKGVATSTDGLNWERVEILDSGEHVAQTIEIFFKTNQHFERFEITLYVGCTGNEHAPTHIVL